MRKCSRPSVIYRARYVAALHTTTDHMRTHTQARARESRTLVAVYAMLSSHTTTLKPTTWVRCCVAHFGAHICVASWWSDVCVCVSERELFLRRISPSVYFAFTRPVCVCACVKVRARRKRLCEIEKLNNWLDVNVMWSRARSLNSHKAKTSTNRRKWRATATPRNLITECARC